MASQNRGSPNSPGTDEEFADEAIATFKRVQDRGDLTLEERIFAMSSLRRLLHWRFETGKSVQDLDAAIETGERLLRTLPASHGDRAEHLDELGYLKTSRFQVKGTEADLDDAISLGREALSILSTCDQRWGQAATNLGYNLSTRCRRTGQLSDLDEAISYARQIVQVTAPNNSLYNRSLLNLAARLSSRFEKTRELADNDEATALNRQLLDRLTPGTVEYGGALFNLGVITAQRFEQTGFWRDLDEAIRLSKLGIDTIPQSHEFHEKRPELLCNLASLFAKRYHRTKNLSDLREEIKFSHESVLTMPIVHSMHSPRGKALYSHLQGLGTLAGAVNAVSEIDELITQAADLMAPMPEVYAYRVVNIELYGGLLSRRYELSGRPWDLLNLLNCALTTAGEKNYYSERNGQEKPAKVDTNALLRLFTPVSRLAVEAQDHSLVSQVNLAMHREYRNLVQTRGFIDALITIEKEVIINVEIVTIHSRSRSREDHENEMREQEKFAEKLGAKTYQHRVKFPELTLSMPGGDPARSSTIHRGAFEGNCKLSARYQGRTIFQGKVGPADMFPFSHHDMPTEIIC